jgi:2-oxoglutarate dehydrogenase E1 component
VYYELLAHRRKTGVTDVAIARLEQIQPFPFDKVAAESARYPNAEVVWMQEEPKNMGCWTFVQDRILTACKVINDKQMTLGYVGRGTMASTAEGYGSVHVKNQLALMDLSMSDNVTSYPPWATKTK